MKGISDFTVDSPNFGHFFVKKYLCIWGKLKRIPECTENDAHMYILGEIFQRSLRSNSSNTCNSNTLLRIFEWNGPSTQTPRCHGYINSDPKVAKGQASTDESWRRWI